MNPNSLSGSMVGENYLQDIEEPTNKEPIAKSFIELDILKELQRELHFFDVENEFDFKVKLFVIYKKLKLIISYYNISIKQILF
jgi:hypothetical protein